MYSGKERASLLPSQRIYITMETFQRHSLTQLFVNDDPNLLSFQQFLMSALNSRDLEYYRVCQQ